MHKDILKGGQVLYTKMILLDGLPLPEHILWGGLFSFILQELITLLYVYPDVCAKWLARPSKRWRAR